MELDRHIVQEIVEAALREDLGSAGDRTSLAIFGGENSKGTSRGRLLARERLILSGIDVARAVFLRCDSGLRFSPQRDDGDRCEAGQVVAIIEGSTLPILTAERTALNFLMRMCGIATAARAAVDEIEGSGARILDTRKTAPGLRHLDKYAVACGGATNHRMGLYDAVMIKDTHLDAGGDVATAVLAALSSGMPRDKITVEVRQLDEIESAIESGAGRILLDNMGPQLLRQAVGMVRRRVVLEASGGLRPGNLRETAESGVDFLSLGWLTHSAPAANLALEMDRAR